MLNSLKVKTKMLLLGSIFMCSIIVVGVIGIVNAQTLNREIRNTFELELRPMNYVQTVATYIAIVNSDLAHISSGLENLEITDEIVTTLNDLEVESQKVERIKAKQQELSSNFNEMAVDLEENVNYLVSKAVVLLGLFDGIEKTDTIESLYSEFTTVLGTAREQRSLLFEQLNNNDFDTAIITVNEAIAAQDRLQEYVVRLVEQFRREAENRYIQSDEMFMNLLLTVFIVTIAVFAISLLLIVLITISITKPINILKSKLTQMASGDLAVEVPTGYKAEFGEMFTNFKEMLGNVNNLIIGAKGLALDVHHSSDNIASALGDVKENVATIDENVNILATGVENQVENLKESAVAMDNIASGVQQIAESSTSVSELATETSTQANDGSAVIAKSVTQMEIINQVVENTSSVVDRLVKRTKTIDEALKAITAIAEQTNLLALNASIEAARAGEQGRGFAVVAEEVSKLADQSKESASEINVLLQEINDDTKEAVQAMGQGKIESKQGIEVIQQAGQAFNSIVEQVTIMTEQIQEVSSTVEELAAGTEEVNASLADVVQTSEKVSEQAKKVTELNESEIAMLERMYKAVNDTTNNVENLEEELNEFKTEKKEDMKKE